MRGAFELENELITQLGKLETIGDDTLGQGLKLDGNISLFDAVVPFLLLYRIPLIFEASRRKSISLYLNILVRGLSARLFGFIDSLRLKRNLKLHINNEKNSFAGHGMLIFAHYNFFRDVLGPVFRELNLKSPNKFMALQIIYDNCNRGLSSFLSFYDSKVQKDKELLDEALGTIRSKVFSKKFKKQLFELEAQFDIKSHLLISELWWLFYREFPRLIVHLAIAENILENKKINVLITADDADQKSRIYCLVASDKGIATLAIQQGVTREDYPDWKHLTVDKVACMGEISKRNILKQGAEKDICTITGHPGFDCIHNRDEENISLLLKKYSIDKGKPIILFASQPYLPGAWTSRKKRIESFFNIHQLFSRRSDLTLLIKPHPSDNVKELISIFKGSENIVLIEGKEDIIPFIQLCDIFMTHFSQTTIQALIAGKPVIIVDLAECYDHSNFNQNIGIDATYEDLIPIANDAGQLEYHIGQLIETDYKYDIERHGLMAEFLYKNIFKADGKATMRITSVIDNLAEENKTK